MRRSASISTGFDPTVDSARSRYRRVCGDLVDSSKQSRICIAINMRKVRVRRQAEEPRFPRRQPLFRLLLHEFQIDLVQVHVAPPVLEAWTADWSRLCRRITWLFQLKYPAPWPLAVDDGP